MKRPDLKLETVHEASDDRSLPTTKPNGEFRCGSLHLIGLTYLGIAQPLFDLLGRSPEFFVARGSEPRDVLAFVAILCIAVPAFLVLLEKLVGMVAPRAERHVHTLLISGLGMLVFLPVTKRLSGLPGEVVLLAAAAAGLALGLSTRLTLVRAGLTLLGGLSLVIPLLFLFGSPMRQVLFAESLKAVPSEGVAQGGNAPVILVVFDEFLAVSIMNEEREIDALRYPNFAALAERSTWYRNATTVSVQTMNAVPAILTGRYPDGRRMPRASDYPESLITLLAGSHEVVGFESVTELCPKELCTASELAVAVGSGKRLTSLLEDSAIVYAHIVLPRDVSRRLPDVTTTWKGFRGDAGAGRVPDAGTLIEGFLDSIGPSPRPRVYFLHTLLPHIPWQYLPSTKRYGPSSTSNFPHGLGVEEWETWSTDDWHVQQGLQRYLLQVGFVDRFVGRLVARLEDASIFDDALIVITGDHGVSFRAGDKRRPVTATNYVDILPVPLFIKAPQQRTGRISDQEALTIDILPTVADLLGVSIPWEVNGSSLLGVPRSPGETKIVYRAEGRQRLEFPDPAEDKYDTLDRIQELFGSGKDQDRLYRIGRYAEIVGHRIVELELDGESEYVAELYQPRISDPIDLSESVLPVHVAGFLDPAPAEPSHLAVALDGVVRAVTKTYVEGKAVEFTAMVPEGSLHSGQMDVELYLLETDEGDATPKARLIRERRAPSYSLARRGGGEVLVTSGGRTIRIRAQDGLRGYLDSVSRAAGRVEFSGWAADVFKSRLPEAVMVFSDGELIHLGHTNVDRGAEAADEAIRWRGFRFNLSDGFLRGETKPRVRLFALFEDGEAVELVYPEGYIWSD